MTRGGEHTRRRSRPRVLLISWYPLDQGVWGPTQRIRQLRNQLREMVELDVISGYRPARRVALARYAFSGCLRGLAGIYVENSTTLPAETDIAFLSLAKSLGIPVLTYIRDAQQAAPEYYPQTSPKRWLSARLFLPAMSLLRAVSSQVGFPSRGLARVVLRGGPAAEEALLLPPGSRDPVDVPLDPDARHLLFVGGFMLPIQGWDILREAIELCRARGIEVELTIVCRPHEEPPRPHPEWVHIERAAGEEIDRLLPRVRASVTPRRKSPYNDLSVPIKVLEYLSYGRPLLVTDCDEQAAVVRSTGAGLVVTDSPEALAEGIAAIYRASAEQLERWAAAARAGAHANSWRSRAERILDLLGVER